MMAYSPQQRKGDNDNFEQWWQTCTEYLWPLMGVAGGVQTPGDGCNETWHGCRTMEKNAANEGYWEGYSVSTRHREMVTPRYNENPASKERGNGYQAQSQTAQEWNKESYRKFARAFLEQGVRVSYYDIRDAMGFTKTNKTVRAIHDEMTMLCGVYEDPSLLNARWIQEGKYKDNVNSAMELLYSYPGGAYPCAHDGPFTFDYEEIKSFLGATKTNKTVRAIAGILEEKRKNPWDEDDRAYTLQDFVYYLVALRVHPPLYGVCGCLICQNINESNN